MDILLPAMGEGITDATITRWLVSEGDNVEEDQPLVEIATDKVDSEIPSPENGVLQKIFAQEGDIPKVGEVIAIVKTNKESEKNTHSQPVASENNTPSAEVKTNMSVQNLPEEKDKGVISQSKPEIETRPAVTPVENTFKNSLKNQFISPYIRNMAKENNISLAELVSLNGSGADGRLTKDDILHYLNLEKPNQKSNSVNISSPEGVRKFIETHGQIKSKGSNGLFDQTRYDIIEMDRMRKIIAQHMVESVQTSPHVTSFVEADLTNLVQWRNKNKKAFYEKHGQKLTLTPLFIEAVTHAIKDFPMINVSVDGDKILVKKDINVGMATALTNGNLIVPVIKNADQLALEGIAAVVNDLAERARINKLKPTEVKGGTFTITNVGSFGNITGTPIINQPEVAILAIGSITRKPAVVKTNFGESIGIRDIIILSLTYDHRVVDGSLGGSFLKRIADYLEAFDNNRVV